MNAAKTIKHLLTALVMFAVLSIGVATTASATETHSRKATPSSRPASHCSGHDRNHQDKWNKKHDDKWNKKRGKHHDHGRRSRKGKGRHRHSEPVLVKTTVKRLADRPW